MSQELYTIPRNWNCNNLYLQVNELFKCHIRYRIWDYYWTARETGEISQRDKEFENMKERLRNIEDGVSRSITWQIRVSKK